MGGAMNDDVVESEEWKEKTEHFQNVKEREENRHMNFV